MKKLTYVLNGLTKDSIPDIEIESICFDPNKCTEKDLLFLTNKHDVDEYISLLPKAAAIVSGFPLSDNISDTVVYIIPLIRNAISIACSRFYCNDISKIKFIGITGTNGKSSTAIILEKIISDYGYRVGLIGTGKIKIGNNILSPECYSMTTPPPSLLYSAIGRMEKIGVDVIIMEVSSHALDQYRVSAIDFDIGIFTNLSEEHLDYHKSMEEYFRSKCKLLEHSKHIIANGDDEYGKDVVRNFIGSDVCGQGDNASIKISSIQNLGFLGSKFNYKSDLNETDIITHLPEIYNVYNIALAIRAAEILGVPKENIKDSIEIIQEIDGRYSVIRDSITVIIDYAHTALAFHNILKSLYSLKKQRQNLIVVFGCGGERDKCKRFAMGRICEEYADRIIITSDNSRGESPMDIISDITRDITKQHEIIVDRKNAIKHAVISANAGDLVAIIGKGPERYIISNGIYYPFDESEIVRSALKERCDAN